MIVINKINFSYSGDTVLRNLSFSLNAGQYFALAGLNGAGKSTLFRLIVDLLRTSSKNDIKILNQSSWDVSSREKLIYLPEKFRIDLNVSPLDYLNLIASVYKQKLNKSKVNYLFDRLELAQTIKNKPVSGLSKGMMQKVGLISCLSVDVPLLLLDEPLSGLDPKARYQIKELLLEEKKGGKTLLYSTHMLADVEELCDSFGILHRGNFQFIGTPKNCMDKFEAETLEVAYMKCINQSLFSSSFS